MTNLGDLNPVIETAMWTYGEVDSLIHGSAAGYASLGLQMSALCCPSSQFLPAGIAEPHPLGILPRAIRADHSLSSVDRSALLA